jgi:hypothetical protein
VKLYLVTTYGDVEPELQGPFASTDERDIAAGKFRNEDDDNGVYQLDIEEDGTPTIYPYSGREMDEILSQLETGDDNEE